jgi:AraC-like DNA-binding protein
MTKLNNINNWPELARQANWSVGKMAKLCGVSVRVLERHFHQTQAKSPKAWLTEQRQKQALELLDGRIPVKEAAARLGYQHAHHFSREFKAYWGYCPAEHAGISR